MNTIDLCLRRKEWEQLFAEGDRLAEERGLTEEAINKELRLHQEERIVRNGGRPNHKPCQIS